MLGSLYLAVFILCGNVQARALLPRMRALARGWIGACLGVLLMMWLPALLAFLMPFDALAHGLAAVLMLGLTAACRYLPGISQSVPARRMDETEKKLLRTMLLVCVPLSVLGAYLQWTHCLNPVDGTLHVGQSTYGDLPLHLSIITSLRGATFPAEYSILPGARLSYPFLMDSFSTSMMVMGAPLRTAVIVPGTVCMALVFAGYFLLAARLTGGRKTALLATLFFFINGGLGFLYTFDLSGGDIRDALQNVLYGWYQTPVNHADFAKYNLRWSNIIADMLVPQRTFLGGLTILLPCIYLLFDGLCVKKRDTRQFVLLGVMAGGLPLLHTHSFLALGLMSAGWLLHDVIKKRGVRQMLLYAAIACLLAAPQLYFFTFRQALESEHFLRFQFNWVNNPSGGGLRDGYVWFWLKNVGLPLILAVLALIERNERRRFIAWGAFSIFIVAEFVLFQPNEYDNNKLFYIWWALCAALAADYAKDVYARLRGLRARGVLAALFLGACFLSGGLSIARECVSDYQMFSRSDVAAAEYIDKSTEREAVFMCWTDHINPASALAGRKIVCGPGLWLYYHGFDLSAREADIRRFYANPVENADVLARYNVSYIILSERERYALDVDIAALDAQYARVYDADGYVIYVVPEG